jgi:hypothetical protein
MNVKLPCEIIRDLLPSYIDGLANEVTKAAVDEHLDECAECTEVCESMKKEYEKEILPEPEQDASEEKVMIHKIKKKLNRKVKIAIEVGVVALLLALGTFELLFNAVINEIPRDEVEVSVVVYPMEEIATLDDGSGTMIGLGDDPDKFVSVSLTDADSASEQKEFVIQMPDSPDSHMTVTQDIVDTYDSLTLIKWKSPYFLRAILWDIKDVDGKRVMYIEYYRTTFLNNKIANSGSVTTSIEFGVLDKIIYLEKDGSETVLWEYEE